MALEREIETYRRKLPELLTQKGKFALVHGEELIGVFDGHEDALTVGYERCGPGPFLVRQVREEEPVLVSSRSLRPCPTSPSPSMPTAP